jgi:DNA-binding transcriptional LysR family regulator
MAHMDWDRLRIFHHVAEAGSLTKAGEALQLSQSAVSRQVSRLEAELDMPLFQRHTRGLILTEQGEILYRTAREMMRRIEEARALISDSRERPDGDLKVTANLALGGFWLAPRLAEFLDLFPAIRLHLLLSDDELDLSAREADVALRLRPPSEPSLIRRRLFAVHFHLYASADYARRFGVPRTVAELDSHRLVAFDGDIPDYLSDLNWHCAIGREKGQARIPHLSVNTLPAVIAAVVAGAGIGALPDYALDKSTPLVRILTGEVIPHLECYLVYPEAMKSVARVQVFRDFLVAKAQRWVG